MDRKGAICKGRPQGILGSTGKGVEVQPPKVPDTQVRSAKRALTKATWSVPVPAHVTWLHPSSLVAGFARRLTVPPSFVLTHRRATRAIPPYMDSPNPI